MLTKPDDKGNSLLYEGNFSPAYNQNIHLRENFLTECHATPIVSRIRRHLGMMLSAKCFPDYQTDLYVKMGLNQSKCSNCTLRMAKKPYLVDLFDSLEIDNKGLISLQLPRPERPLLAGKGSRKWTMWIGEPCKINFPAQ